MSRLRANLISLRFTDAELAEYRLAAGDVPLTRWIRKQLRVTKCAHATIRDHCEAIANMSSEQKSACPPGLRAAYAACVAAWTDRDDA